MTKYDKPVTDYGDLMTVEDFKEEVRSGGFVDYDGFGHPVKNGLSAPDYILPSTSAEIPRDATHIVWYNK